MMNKSSGTTRAKKAKVLSSTIVYEGPVFGIRRDEVIEPSGVRTTREVITHPGSVVVPSRSPRRENRAHPAVPLRRTAVSVGVGRRADRSRRNSQRGRGPRNLIEETGFRAKRLRVFLDVFPTPGFLEERMFILLAEGLTAGEAEPEEDEKIISRAYSRKQLEEMIRGGRLRDAKTIAGILYYSGSFPRKIESEDKFSLIN